MTLDNEKIRALVVDDSAFMRRAIKEMLSSDPKIEVVDIARNGREGLEMAQKYKPDIITLDIEMPEMDGLTALRHIMRQCPTRVLMLSSLTTEGSHASLRALNLGAVDVLAKDMSQISLSITNIQEELLSKVRALGAAKRPEPGAAEIEHAHDSPPTFKRNQFDVICIGSSTGGPPVLETILGAMTEGVVPPIVVAQHMPKIFTQSLTERLNEFCKLPVVHIQDGMAMQRRTIHIAPGGQHTAIIKAGLAQWKFKVSDEPEEELYKPSVNVLFSSAAEMMKRRVLAVVLTGMGEDGLNGARELHQHEAPILAQSAETCVVYGMPKAVTQAAIIQASLSPQGITKSILTLDEQANRDAA